MSRPLVGKLENDGPDYSENHDGNYVCHINRRRPRICVCGSRGHVPQILITTNPRCVLNKPGGAAARPRSGLMTRIPISSWIETGLTGPDPGAGKFEIAVQADRLQINGRKSLVILALRRSSCFSGWRRAATSESGPPASLARGEGVLAIANADCRPVGQSRRRRHYVCRGRGAQVSRIEWDRNGHRAGMSCGLS